MFQNLISNGSLRLHLWYFYTTVITHYYRKQHPKYGTNYDSIIIYIYIYIINLKKCACLMGWRRFYDDTQRHYNMMIAVMRCLPSVPLSWVHGNLDGEATTLVSCLFCCNPLYILNGVFQAWNVGLRAWKVYQFVPYFPTRNLFNVDSRARMHYWRVLSA